MRTHTETVSFRADTDLLKRIDEECERFGLSRGSWVRGVIIAHAFRENAAWEVRIPEEIQQSLDKLPQRFEEIKTNLARAALIILTKVGDMPIEDARDLVRSKLMSKEEA